MGFICHVHNIINDYEKYKLTELTESNVSLKDTVKNLPEKIKLPEKIESPRMKKRVKSMDNFIKFQWSWTL